MKIVVIMNPKAGNMNRTIVERKIREALFRCELDFRAPASFEELQECIVETQKSAVDGLIVCGGDGTINAVVGPLVRCMGVGKIPNVCVVPSGTANDLATEEGISRRIERVARTLLDGSVKMIDILSVTGDGKTAYMLTNGGVGVPARTAERANSVRGWFRQQLEDPALSPKLRPWIQMGASLVQKAGSKIYEVLLVQDVLNWDSESWEVEVEIPGKTVFKTRAPFILINNQPSIGGKFVPAPFTANSDGTFNVVLIQPTKLLSQAKIILDMRMRRIREIGLCPSFETTQIRLRSLSRPMTFFGDGEILHKDVREITINCIHPGLPVTKMGAA